jgi:hypothetical protein
VADYKKLNSIYSASTTSKAAAISVFNRLSENVDPAELTSSHKIIPYGNQLAELYALSFEADVLPGFVYASDFMITFDKSRLKPVKAVAIVGHYNESDILFWSISTLRQQGIEVVIVDNWSDDEHYEAAKKIAKDFKAQLIRFPDEKSDIYEWKKILDFKSELAKKYKGYWVIHQDADEIRLSSLPGFTFAEMLSYADYLGFNSIDHLVLNVRPTLDGFTQKTNPFMFFSSFEFGSKDTNQQVKAWKQGVSKVDLSSTGGHSASFLNRKIFPLKQYLFHFPLRSLEQGNRKIFQERIARFNAEERQKDWHVHYDNYLRSGENSFKLFDRYELLPMFEFRALSNNLLLRNE